MNIFDFDGTLYRGDSSVDLWKHCLKRYPAIAKFIPGQLVAGIEYVSGAISLDDFKSRFYRYFKGIPDMKAEVEVFWDLHQAKLRMDVLAYSSDDDLVVSASPEFLIAPICERLKLRSIASVVDSESGELLGPNCKGEEKVRRIEAQGYPRHYEKAFSDSMSDTPIARLADEAFLVTKSGIKAFPLTEDGDR